jgi:hypothetical protein
VDAARAGDSESQRRDLQRHAAAEGAKDSIAEVALPDDRVFDGLENVFAGRKRGKKAAVKLFQTRDELLE